MCESQNKHLEQLKGRIIFMSMYNDVDWHQNRKEEVRKQYSTCVAAHAKVSLEGRWTFLRPEEEQLVWEPLLQAHVLQKIPGRFQETTQMFGCHARRASSCATLRTPQVPQQQTLTQVERNGAMGEEVLRQRGSRNGETPGRVCQGTTNLLAAWCKCCALQSLLA